MNPTIFSFRLFLIACLLTTSTSFAQQQNLDEATINKLKEVSAIMADQKNENRIMVELMIDGFIHEGQSLELSVDSNAISLDNRALPADVQAKYLALMFPYTRVSRGPGPRIAEMLDPASNFRKLRKKDDFKMPSYDAVIAELFNDGTADSLASIEIIYNWKGIVVNGRKLTGAKERKYKKLFLETAGFSVSNKSENMRLIQGTPHRLKVETAQ